MTLAILVNSVLHFFTLRALCLRIYMILKKIILMNFSINENTLWYQLKKVDFCSLFISVALMDYFLRVTSSLYFFFYFSVFCF
jgi:hypothetical protein